MGRHGFVHVEWGATDLERERRFLEKLFGWEFQQFSPDFMMFTPQSGPGGGIQKVEQVEPSSQIRIYIEVEDIDSTLGLAVELGGNVLQEKTVITPDMGSYAHLTDPEGNLLGIWQR
jgi:predicted enzyme related to lactoylglutathione lyase